MRRQFTIKKIQINCNLMKTCPNSLADWESQAKSFLSKRQKFRKKPLISVAGTYVGKDLCCRYKCTIS